MDNIDDMWFQQEEATSHTVKSNIRLLHRILPGWITSYFGDMPQLTCPQSYWHHITFFQSTGTPIKSHVYNIQPCTTDNLKWHFHDELTAIQEQMLYESMTT
jgi:hypothetical protein